MLGVEPPRKRGVPPERLDRAVIIPAPIHVAGASLVAPHVAELRVEHRLAGLLPGRLEVPARPGKGAVAHPVQVRLPAHLSLTRSRCACQRQPGRYSCHELRSVSVWPRPQHTELSSTSLVESSALASR